MGTLPEAPCRHPLRPSFADVDDLLGQVEAIAVALPPECPGATAARAA